jgi:hypothetical protein
MKYDFETLRDGVRTIGNQANNIFENETLTEDEEEKLSKHIFSHINRVGRLAVSRGDEDFILEVIDNLRRNGIIAAEQKLDIATYCAVLSLEDFWMASVKQKLKLATWRVISSLEDIGKIAAKEQLKNLW